MLSNQPQSQCHKNNEFTLNTTIIWYRCGWYTVFGSISQWQKILWKVPVPWLCFRSTSIFLSLGIKGKKITPLLFELLTAKQMLMKTQSLCSKTKTKPKWTTYFSFTKNISDIICSVAIFIFYLNSSLLEKECPPLILPAAGTGPRCMAFSCSTSNCAGSCK